MSEAVPWVALAGLTVFLLWVDLHFFARGREPTFREGVIWSIGWLVISLLAGVSLLFLDAHGTEDFVTYTTVYFIERSLSLDNLFVFLLLFAYFGVPTEHRARLLFWGITAALVLRGLAILGGVALLEQLHFFIYILGVLLLFLAYRILRGVEDNVDPDNNFVVKLVRRVFPVTGEYHGKHWFVKQEGTRYATPMFVCLAAIVAADIAFAVDSIPAAFAITRDSVLIWMANIFALLGLRALFVLVEGLIRRFRYLDETIAIVLGIVAIKLLVEDLYKVGPVLTLVIVFVAFTIGIVASVIADHREPESEAKREERTESLRELGRAPRSPQPPNSRSWRSTSASTSSGGSPRASRRALRAITRSRTSSRRRGVDGRRGQAGELVLDVHLGLAARRGAGVAGAEHLADLVVALGGAHGSAGRRRRPDLAVVADAAAPDLVVGLAAGEQRDHRDHGGDPDDREDDDAEGLLHRHHGPMFG